MQDSNAPTKKIVIRKYGARLLGGEAAERTASGILFAQNKLWNQLVEIERRTFAQWQQIVALSDERLTALTGQYGLEEQALESLKAERNAARARKRSKAGEAEPLYKAAIAEKAALLKDLRRQMKERKTEAKVNAKPRLDELEAQRRAAIKVAAAQAGLWWCHSEIVLNRFDVARSKALKSGRQLQFHRYDGEGSMYVRFSPGLLLDSSDADKTAMLKIREPSAKEMGRKTNGRHKTLWHVTLRAGKPAEDGVFDTLSFLVTEHAGAELQRSMPLKTVTAKREMRSGRPEWFLVFMFVSNEGEEPRPLAQLPRSAIGMDFGFRVVQGGLRVGSVSRGPDRPVEHIVLPHEWIKRMERADRLRSELDTQANQFWAQLSPLLTAEALAQLPEESWFRRLAEKARRAKRAYPSLLLALADEHLRAEEPLGLQCAELMRTWARSARKLQQAVVGVRRRAVEARTHLYRNVAARLVREAGLVSLKDTNFRDIAVLEKPDGTENDLVLTARRHRTWAAPSELRSAVLMAAKREQLVVQNVPSPHTTVTCHVCGHINPGPMEDLVFRCQACDTLWDIDENSAHLCREIALNSTHFGE
ncbi:MAG: transposase [Patescibacteria group bacterium]|nr:transposase [Patescibacteria group bacterium]